MELLEENIDANFCDSGPGYCFLQMTPKGHANKEQIDKFDFIKLKHICASKDIIKK